MELTGVARSQQGFVTWQQLRASLPRAEVREALRSGHVVRVSRNVYQVLEPESVLGPARRAPLSLSEKSGASHTTALRLAGVPFFVADLRNDPVLITVPRNSGRVKRPGCVVFRRGCGEDLALTMTPPGRPFHRHTVLRALVDCGRDLDLRTAVSAMEGAIRLGKVTHQQLERAARERSRCRGGDRLLTAVSLVNPETESVLESLVSLALKQAGISFTTQLVIGRYRADFAITEARLVIEADGMEHHSAKQDFESDRARWNAFACAGWTLVRISWEMVVRHPERVVEVVRSAARAHAARLAA